MSCYLCQKYNLCTPDFFCFVLGMHGLYRLNGTTLAGLRWLSGLVTIVLGGLKHLCATRQAMHLPNSPRLVPFVRQTG
jgi:hypothetical protein